MNNIAAISYTISILANMQIKMSQNQQLDSREQWLLNVCGTVCYQPQTTTPVATSTLPPVAAETAKKQRKPRKKADQPQESTDVPCAHGTKVVRIRRKGTEIVQGCDVYIGRRCRLGGWDLDQSKWNNPFTVKECGSVEEACRRYEEHLRSKPELLQQLPELRGKTLGCWCKPNMCHGDVLVKLLNEYCPVQGEPPVQSTDQPNNSSVEDPITVCTADGECSTSGHPTVTYWSDNSMEE